MTSTGPVVFTYADVAEIVAERPEARDAINSAVLGGLEEAITAVERSAVRAVVLRGAGDRGFASGGDLKELAEVRSRELEPAPSMAACTREILDRLGRLPVSVVAALMGTKVLAQTTPCRASTRRRPTSPRRPSLGPGCPTVTGTRWRSTRSGGEPPRPVVARKLSDHLRVPDQHARHPGPISGTPATTCGTSTPGRHHLDVARACRAPRVASDDRHAARHRVGAGQPSAPRRGQSRCSWWCAMHA